MAAKPTAKINFSLIEEHWDDLLRLSGSIKFGHATASLIAARRTAEELGVAPVLLREAGTVRYNHPDPASGLVEQEYNHLIVGLVRAELRPDPEEVCDVAFVTPDGLAELREQTTLSAWFGTVLEVALPAVRELTGPSAGW